MNGSKGRRRRRRNPRWGLAPEEKTEDGGVRRRRVRERSFEDGDSAEEVGDGGFKGGDTSVGEKEARRMHGRRQTLLLKIKSSSSGSLVFWGGDSLNTNQ